MQHESGEAVGQLALGAFQHLRNCCGHIVEADTGRNAADVFKNTLHANQQTFLILRRKDLDVGFVSLCFQNKKPSKLLINSAFSLETC